MYYIDRAISIPLRLGEDHGRVADGLELAFVKHFNNLSCVKWLFTSLRYQITPQSNCVLIFVKFCCWT